jgi:hypothetical protein
MTEQLPPEQGAADHRGDEVSNEPQLPRRSRVVAWVTLGAVGVAAAIGGVVALKAGGAADGSGSTALAQAAAATSPSPSASGRTHNDGRRGPAGPGFGGMFGGPGGPRGIGGFGPGGKVLHGESTVQTKDGKTQIVDTQSGTISAVDTGAKTITVASTDKVTFTYVVGASTRLIDFAASSPAKVTLADLKVGDTIVVVATRSGDTRTATSVVDGMPTPGKNGPMGGQPWAGHPGPGLHAPHPSASATGTSA